MSSTKCCKRNSHDKMRCCTKQLHNPTINNTDYVKVAFIKRFGINVNKTFTSGSWSNCSKIIEKNKRLKSDCWLWVASADELKKKLKRAEYEAIIKSKS